MATPKTPADIPMLPHRRQGEIDYASLEFDPNEKNATPDAMEQNLELAEILGLFRARFTDFNRRPDVFLDNETFICYDPSKVYDPATQAYDRNWRAEQAYAIAVQGQRDAVREERDAALAEVERLRELLRRKNSEEGNETQGDANPC